MHFQILFFVLFVVVVFIFWKPLLIRHIKTYGVTTQAEIRMSSRRYNVTIASKNTLPRVKHVSTADEVTLIYKVSKVRHTARPLNFIYSLRYNNRQKVDAKYLKHNPKYIIVL